MYKIYYSRKVFALLNDHPSYYIVFVSLHNMSRQILEFNQYLNSNDKSTSP